MAEYKVAEEELPEGEARYRSIFQHVGVSLWEEDFTAIKSALDELRGRGVSDFQSYFGEHPEFVREMIGKARVVEVNDESVLMFGAKDKAEMAESLSKTFTPESEEVFTGELLAIVEGRTRFTAETIRMTLRGERLDILLTVIFPPPGAAFDRVLVSLIDISERKRAARERERLLASEQAARQQAEEANRFRDDFIATLSHELRTPLTAILGWSRLLRDQNFSEERAANALDIIERNARAQAQLIDDLLDVSRIMAGKLRLDLSPVDPAAAVVAATDTIRPAAEAKGISLQTHLDPQAWRVSGDLDRLQQVVWNLVSNAVKFTPEGGRVRVRLERVNSRIEIVVSDTGMGISPEFMPHVFERFRQADKSSTRQHGGLGLGLPIVRHLVELHGGRVRADSAGEGQGATFTVSLPLLAVRTSAAGEMERVYSTGYAGAVLGRPPRLDGLRVLVVDDDKDVGEIVSLMLNRSGARVIVSESATDALEVLRRELPDVLISDIGMPGEDGYWLIRKVRALAEAEGGKTPAAALTGYARADDRMKILGAGFQAHVPKPVDLAELTTLVAVLAGRAGELPTECRKQDDGEEAIDTRVTSDRVARCNSWIS
jgi:signal transduction histidine kinase/FixJ family two-component response regulator